MKLRVSQKIASPTLRAHYQEKSPKCSEICFSQLRSFKSFGGSSVDYLKITGDKSSNAELILQTQGWFRPAFKSKREANQSLHSTSNREAHSSLRLSINAELARGPHLSFNAELARGPRLSFNAKLAPSLCLSINAKLAQSPRHQLTSQFKCGCQPHMRLHKNEGLMSCFQKIMHKILVFRRLYEDINILIQTCSWKVSTKDLSILANWGVGWNNQYLQASNN